MTLDKQNNGHLAKPFTPTLSAAFNRANKAPLTPKLANPSSLRTPRRLTPLDHPGSTSSRQSPEPSLLNANVTPRSGSRNSRRDGPILSPGGTPANGQYSPQPSFSQLSTTPRSNIGVYRTDRSPVVPIGKFDPPRTIHAKTLTAELNTVSRPHSSSDLSYTSPMFFHASDARSVSGSSDVDTRSRGSGKSASAATFVYANGEAERQAAIEETSKRRSSGLYRPAVVTNPPITSPRLKSPKLSDSISRLSDGIPQSGPQLDSSFETRSQIHSSPLGTFLPRPALTISKHRKSSSLDIGHSFAHQRETCKEALRPSPIIISPSDSGLNSSTVGSDSIPGLRPRVFSNGSTTSLDSLGSASQSPVKSEPPGNNGVVLSARVERKILDLEISNSSLLAINRTLEREMRKQNLELRRYRRLSRSGRLSVAPSTRSVSGALSIPSEIDEGTSELSPSLSPEEISDFSDEDESTLEDSVVGTDSVMDEETRQGIRDEKRFIVDLKKHQELLADSQKMNQSLKRCLGWTEELIKEAKKALEYNVHVSDVQLGGRVLNPDELNEVGEAGLGLLGSVAESTMTVPSLGSEFPELSEPPIVDA